MKRTAPRPEFEPGSKAPNAIEPDLTANESGCRSNHRAVRGERAGEEGVLDPIHLDYLFFSRLCPRFDNFSSCC